MKLSKAIIISGGFGTRMKELTRYVPKTMLPLQGRPILEYSLDLCTRHDIENVAISVHYLSHTIKNYFRDGADFGLNIRYLEEPEPMGTAGALHLAKEWLDEPFMMCNADELKDLDLHEMYRQHINTGALATIALTSVIDPSQYGVVDLNGSKIKRFVEKPAPSEAPSNLINSGLYILDPKVIDYIPKGYAMIERDVFPKLAAEGKLCGFKFSGQWFDTGTKERYMLAEKMWKNHLLTMPWITDAPPRLMGEI